MHICGTRGRWDKQTCSNFVAFYNSLRIWHVAFYIKLLIVCQNKSQLHEGVKLIQVNNFTLLIIARCLTSMSTLYEKQLSVIIMSDIKSLSAKLWTHHDWSLGDCFKKGYPSEAHLQLKSHEMFVVCNIQFGCQNFLKFFARVQQ